VNIKDEERVLVVPTPVFHALGLFHGFTPEVDRYLPALLDAAHLRYLRRGDAETDPTFKQLIPYVVLRWRDSVFHYTRGAAGGEARLRARRSIGIGGHVSAEDGTPDANAYTVGMRREVEEEVILDSAFTERTIGLINDDRTPVGQVHLGIVHMFDLEQPRVERREDALAEVGFTPLADLRGRQDEFETWSQFLLAALGDPP
jgi:predicted NUDIX family phosphoesterase